MTTSPVVRLGELGPHARGRNLELSFGATAAAALPAHGSAFVFGKELQRDAARATEWVTWAEAPGRLLIVVPPFVAGPAQLPAPWTARPVAPVAGGSSRVAQLVASERRHELVGNWVPVERIAGEVVTMGWRRHPAGGLMVVTALPLWSLTLLDHRDACRAWLDDLSEQAGRPGAQLAPDERGSNEELSGSEWTVLLHWLTGPFASAEQGLAALGESPLFRLDPAAAGAALAGLGERGLVAGGDLTPAAEELLSGSRYSDYADELRRMHHA